MRWLKDLLFAGLLFVLGDGKPVEAVEPIVPPGPPDRRAERIVLALLGLASAGAIGFVVAYAVDPLPHRTQYLGLALGVSLASIAAALLIVGRRLVVTEELAGPYPGREDHAEDRSAVERIVADSGSRFTRRGLLKAGAAAAGGALGLALLAPLTALGPVFSTTPFTATPWRRGRRLVGEDGAPLRAADIEQGTFYTAFPEGADREAMAAPVIVVRLDPSQLHLPPGRAGWAPGGILAYSKICTHAGCAIALYRKPTFAAREPRPAFVCPCHYSTFDPATGGTVIFGPAGRPLPQLPVTVDRSGVLRAAGTFSGPVGPSWWGVRSRKAQSG